MATRSDGARRARINDVAAEWAAVDPVRPLLGRYGGWCVTQKARLPAFARSTGTSCSGFVVVIPGGMAISRSRSGWAKRTTRPRKTVHEDVDADRTDDVGSQCGGSRMTLKTISFWAYPSVLLAAWVASAAWMLSAVPTIQPSLRSIAASGSRPSTEPLEPAVVTATAHAHSRRTASGRARVADPCIRADPACATDRAD